MTEDISQPTQTTETADNPQTQTQAEDNWKSNYSEYSNAKPFLDSSKDEKEFISKALNGYENMSKKFGQREFSIKDSSEYELSENAKWFGDIAFENKLNKDQVKNLETKFNEHIKSVLEEQNKAFDEALQKEWGDNYESNFIQAKAFLSDNLSEQDIQLLNGLDNNALLILSKTALSLKEKYVNNMNVPSAVGGAGSSVDSLEARLKEIMADPDYLKPTMSNYQRREGLLKESIEIRTKINKLKGN